MAASVSPVLPDTVTDGQHSVFPWERAIHGGASVIDACSKNETQFHKKLQRRSVFAI
ncbi:hypothetical protein ACQR1W_18880 [Bradyrhizobium sp. HKCCYLS1011]|uniref:hypothetical protein n=1 Tax=Bradyrhizobium sp. HKCCYLS1011 TaxID=3420733 RepID=UPI003EC0E8B3